MRATGLAGKFTLESVALSAVIGSTVEVIGGGKFANGAISGVYIMMLNHLALQAEKKKFKDPRQFVDEYFSFVEGLNEIHTDKVPEGYKLEGEVFVNDKGEMIRGFTRYLGDGKSDVYLAPVALKNAFELYEVLGHEMIHVAHLNHFRDKYVRSHSEYSAYSWNRAVKQRLYPNYPNKHRFLLKQLRKYKPNRNYNYDKFGFSSSPPHSLWNWDF